MNWTELKNIGFLVILPLTLMIFGLNYVSEVFAQSDNAPPPLILPGDFFYPLKIAWEDTDEWLTYSDALKAKITAKHTAERIRESDELEKQNRPIPDETKKRFDEKKELTRALLASSERHKDKLTDKEVTVIEKTKFAFDLIKHRDDIIIIKQIYGNHSECRIIESDKSRFECFERLDVEINDLEIVEQYCKKRISSSMLDNDRMSYDLLRENCPILPGVPQRAYEILYGD